MSIEKTAVSRDENITTGITRRCGVTLFRGEKLILSAGPRSKRIYFRINFTIEYRAHRRPTESSRGDHEYGK